MVNEQDYLKKSIQLETGEIKLTLCYSPPSSYVSVPQVSHYYAIPSRSFPAQTLFGALRVHEFEAQEPTSKSNTNVKTLIRANK